MGNKNYCWLTWLVFLGKAGLIVLGDSCDRIISDWDWDWRLRFDELKHCVPVCLPSTSSFTDKLVQNVPVHQCSNLSANELVQNVPVCFAEYQLVCWQVGTLTNWNILYQFVDELEHFVPVCGQTNWYSASELVHNVPVHQISTFNFNLNLNLRWFDHIRRRVRSTLPIWAKRDTRWRSVHCSWLRDRNCSWAKIDWGFAT